MYKSPNKFKKNVDEEFYPIIDAVVQGISIDDFKTMTKDAKTDIIRSMMCRELDSGYDDPTMQS
jgi:uncharacterized protein YlaI